MGFGFRDGVKAERMGMGVRAKGVETESGSKIGG